VARCSRPERDGIRTYVVMPRNATYQLTSLGNSLLLVTTPLDR
jgi:hypothetical protein